MPFIRQHSLAVGLALMFALTWPFYSALGLVVGYGLSFACLVVTGLAQGTEGIKSLLRRFLLWRVGVRWYITVLIGPFALYSGVVAFCHLWGSPTLDFTRTPAAEIFGTSRPLWLFIVPFFIIDAITNGEELAWRGFVLPRCQRRFSALTASVIIGVIWGLWHLPKLVPAGGPQDFAYIILHNVAASVLYTWIYNSTAGSLLLVSLFHAAFNTAYVFLAAAPGAAGYTFMRAFMLIGECLAAGVVVAKAGPVALSRRAPVLDLPCPFAEDTNTAKLGAQMPKASAERECQS